MNKGLRIALVATVIFSSGLAAGHSLSGLRARVQRRHGIPRVDGERPSGTVPGAPGPMGQKVEFLRKAQKELDLTPEQRRRVEAHLDETRERIRLMWEPQAPRFRSEVELLKQRIHGELTPSQAKQFDRIIKARNRRSDQPGRTGEQ